MKALEKFLIVHGHEFKYLSCWHLMKEQPMMSDHNFGSVKAVKPIQLVPLNSSSALLLPNIQQLSTPAKNHVPCQTAPPTVPQTLVTPVKFSEDEFSDSHNDQFIDDFYDAFDDNDGFAILDANSFEHGEPESSILNASTTTPLVDTSHTSANNTTASTTKLTGAQTMFFLQNSDEEHGDRNDEHAKQKHALKPTNDEQISEAELVEPKKLVGNERAKAKRALQPADDAETTVVPQNSELDLGAPNNLVGAKRAKRIRALERETRQIKEDVEKLQNIQATILKECMATSKYETQEQLKALFLNWSNQTGMNNGGNTLLSVHQEKQELAPQSFSNAPAIEPLIENEHWSEGGFVHFVVHCF